METYVTLPLCNCVNYLKSSMAPPLDILFSLLLRLLLLRHSTVAFQQSVDLKNRHRTSVIRTVSFHQSADLKNKHRTSVILTVSFHQSVDLKNKHKTSVILFLTVSFQQSADLKNKYRTSVILTFSQCVTQAQICVQIQDILSVSVKAAFFIYIF